LADLWRDSEVLKQVRWAAEQIPQTTLKQSDAGDFCTFCPGVAERQTGSPFKMYPQAEVVAEARLTAYNRKQAERTTSVGESHADPQSLPGGGSKMSDQSSESRKVYHPPK